jgi:hypothetical protein
MTFNLPLSSSVSNLFGNWLNEVANKDKSHIRVGVWALLWAIWTARNNFIYRFGQALDPYVVFSTAGGVAIGHEYWVQLFGDGSTRF